MIVSFVEVIVEVHGQCESGWMIYNNICYKIVDASSGDRIIYDSATTNCNGYGGGLAKVNSPQIRMFLVGYMDQTKDYWIGLKDNIGTNDKLGYEWAIDNEVANYFTDWGNGEPDYTFERCVTYEYTNSNWRWHDVKCHGMLVSQKKAYYICQKGS